MPIKVKLFEVWKQKELELGRNITITEVAEAADINRDTVSRIKRGVAYPDQNTVDKLCRYFNLPPGPVPWLVWEPD